MTPSSPEANLPPTNIKAVLFDFGGVLAEEGFREGLMAIAERFGLSPEPFFRAATETIYHCGYVLGKTNEAYYWQLLRQNTKISGTDQELTDEILNRFTLRPRMLDAVKEFRLKGLIVGILSDQTDWLDRLDKRYRFFNRFDRIYNSYHIGKSKRDPSLFIETVANLNIDPGRALFVDDNPGNIARASSQGLATYFFRDQDLFFAEIKASGLL